MFYLRSEQFYDKCPTRNATCNFCQKTEHYERTCRGRSASGRGRVGLIHEDGTEGEHTPHDPDENASNYGINLGWLTDSNAVAHGWDSNSSTDYFVMSIRRKQEEEMNVAGQNWR